MSDTSQTSQTSDIPQIAWRTCEYDGKQFYGFPHQYCHACRERPPEVTAPIDLNRRIRSHK